MDRQVRCCSNCGPDVNLPEDEPLEDFVELVEHLPCRPAPPEHAVSLLKGEIDAILIMVEESFEFSFYHNPPLAENCAQMIIDGVEMLEDEYALLDYGIADEKYMLMLYNVIEYYCPLF